MVKSFSWSNISLQVAKSDKGNGKILDDISGEINSGEIMALMGPSGSGKTTLLNVLAHRPNNIGAGAQSHGEICVDNVPTSRAVMQKISSYVEQEDSLIGALTVKETIAFSASFAGVPVQYKKEAVNEIIDLLGLKTCQNLKIGTPLQKGISGGQKRRVSIASQLITKPSVLFLDEPTSGLDSVAAREVILTIKKVALTENIIVICSIHQPSTFTFELFDKVLFLSRGQTVYNGYVKQLTEYFLNTQYPIPQFCNPSEYVLDLINTDFTNDDANSTSTDTVKHLVEFFKNNSPQDTTSEIKDRDDSSLDKSAVAASKNMIQKNIQNTIILLKRSLLKSGRDVLAYHVRIFMYFGLAVLMGTVWLRLSSNQRNIQPFINAIFFSGAFMSFMSVAYVPSYLEDFHSFKKDRLNGLYGPFAFMFSNFLIGLPFLFIITLLFSIFTYFMIHFRQTFTGFAYYTMWLFLDLICAESMTIFITSLFPNFVVALALTAFANGLWMSVGGFLVPSNILNSFWYYTFYWINYQRYVFQGMMFNEFSTRVFNCDSSCHCLYDSELASVCKISGKAVLENNGYSNEDKGLWIGILIVLIFVFRFGSYLSLKYLKK